MSPGNRTPGGLSRKLPRTALLRSVRPGVRLLWEADALLALVPQLRATGFVAHLARLRERLAAMLRDFHARARTAGVEVPRVALATEVLAALLDHVVTSMPWGADAGWQSLGASFAAPGGGRRPQAAGQRLLELALASSSDAGMRELIGVALALGFDGRRAGADDSLIDRVRAQLATYDAKAGAHAERELSPQWRSSVQRGGALTSWLPLWVSSLVVAAALAVLFLGLELSLGAKTDRLYARIAALNGPATTAVRTPPAPQARLAGALSEQLASQSVSVRDEIDRSVIVVPGVQLFEAGNAGLRPAARELLHPIAVALQQTPGRIQVIGHTEGSAARSARYPSEWDLSVDRARSVQEALRGLGIEASRLAYDGRASLEPLAADGPTRAVGGDGRIEIVLLAGRR